MVWMLRPVERSITVSAPAERIAQTHLVDLFSTDEVTVELPILALILVRKLRPMIIGSSCRWLMLAGDVSRGRAISAGRIRGDESGQVGVKAFAVGQRSLGAFQLNLAAEIFAGGDVDHLLGDDAGAGEFQLRDHVVARAAQRLVMRLEGGGGLVAGDLLPLSTGFTSRP